MILGLIDHDRGVISPLSFQMLTAARHLAEALSTPLHAILLGRAARPLAEQLGAYGVVAAHLADDERLDAWAPEAWAQSVAELLGSTGPHALLAAGSEHSNELMAHIAARTGLALAANCIAVQPGEAFTVTRTRWGGSLFEESRLHGVVKLLTIAPHAVVAEMVATASVPTLHAFMPALDEKHFRVRVARHLAIKRDSVALADARVVVGGGRGVGSSEGFRALEELAGLLGGAVGCSRAVTSQGWRPHADQVGQTGTRIAPDLYIACGISGAIQHMVGCKAARYILAINTDPEAPMVAQAHYAIIGDLHKVVPALCAAIRAAREQG